MKLGVALPLIDVAVGGDPAAIRDFAQAAEEIGYQDLAAPDHVLGVNVASRPDWGDRNTSADLFHDPFVLFGFLAGCTQAIEFSTQVLILAQRQAVLVAKQAASLDMLCGGRFRLGIGVGWNPVEFTGLNENFHNRGRRSEEQVEVMKALWTWPTRPAMRQTPRSGQHRHRYAGVGRHWRRGRMARSGALLEILRRHPPDPGDLFRPRTSAPHRRPIARRPSRRDQALLERGRRPVVVQQTGRGAA